MSRKFLVSAEGFAAQHSFALQSRKQRLLEEMEGEAVPSRPLATYVVYL